MKRIAATIAVVLSLSSISPSFAQSAVSSTSIDEYLYAYIDQVETKRIPLMVDREGMKWFAENTSATLTRAGDLPIWAVNPSRANAEAAVAALDDNSLLINHTYSIPKLPASDVSDTSLTANPLEITGADVLHDEGYKGDGKAVAILDTGIQASHDYFKDSQGNSRIVAQACFVQALNESAWAKCKNGLDSDTSANSADISHMTTYYQEYMDHGTHVAGLAAGHANADAPGGIAPDADIVAVRVFGSEGASDFDIWSALNWVADNASTYHISAVNLSLGSGLYSPGDCYSDQDIYWEYWYRLIFQELIDVGVAPLVATGNDGAQTRISSPACIEPAIAIGSSNAYDTSLNSYETISYFTNISSQLELLAPGHNVLSSLPGSQYGLMSGTSMATPVTAGVFTLLQSISEKPVDQWLTILKSTGTPLDGDSVQNLPRINVDWAACEALDCLVPPKDINFTTSLVQNTLLDWNESAYGSTATSFDIEYGDNTLNVMSPVTQANVVVQDFSDVIRIRTRNGSEVSDWAVLQPFRYSSSNSQKLKTVSARQIVDVQLAGDYCTSDYSPYIAFKYESPSSTLRKVWIDGPNGFTSFSETAYTPQNGESLTADNKTKQLVITDPVSALNASSKGYVVSNLNYGNGYSLSSLYAEIENAEYSPSAPTGLVATGGPSRAVLTWDSDDSGLWKVVVDGEVVDEVNVSTALISLTPGDHEVSVCAVKTSGANTYTSIKTSQVVTALPGIFQEIQNPVTPTLNANGATGILSATVTSGLGLNFASLTSDICTVNSSTGSVTPILHGDCLVRISQPGNGTYAAADPIDVTFAIGLEIPKSVRNLKAVAEVGKVKISWKAPTNAFSSAITGYTLSWRVKIPGKKFGSWKTVTLPTSQREFTSKKFAKGSKIEFRVFAKADGLTSPVATIAKTV